MKIYLIGYVVISLGLLYFFYYPDKLYALTVFSIPFTGTAVFYISNQSYAIEGIRASMFLGALCLLRHVLTIFIRKKIPIKNGLKNLIFLVLLIALAVIGSLSMPAIIGGDLLVLDAYSDLLTYAKPQPLFLKMQYVTQVAYFVFGCLLAYYFSIKNHDSLQIEKTVRIYLNATLFVCCWGLLEIILFHLGISYPAFIFNQVSMNYQGTIVLDGRPRITSVALEPSIMSQQLATALPFLFWGLKDRTFYNGIRAKLMFFALIIVVLLLSTSATSIFAIVVFFALVLFSFLKKKKVNFYILFLSLTLLVGFVVIIPFLITKFVEKLSTYSGAERLKALIYGWQYFLEYPLYGIGWGVFPSWDLLICLLTGIGLIGTFLFLLLLVNIYLKFRNVPRSTLNIAIAHSFLMLLFVSEFAGFIYHSQYFWLILGLAMAASASSSGTPHSLKGTEPAA